MIGFVTREHTLIRKKVTTKVKDINSLHKENIFIQYQHFLVLLHKIARSGDDQVVTFKANDWQFSLILWSHWLLMSHDIWSFPLREGSNDTMFSKIYQKVCVCEITITLCITWFRFLQLIIWQKWIKFKYWCRQNRLNNYI